MKREGVAYRGEKVWRNGSVLGEEKCKVRRSGESGEKWECVEK